MDLAKTGKFIAEKRKAKKLTQMQLAEKLMVSEKTISKWECGKGFPDTTLMLPLCEILEISSNELLCGKQLSNEDFKDTADKNVIALKSKNEHLAKLLLITEWFVGILAVITLLSGTCIAAYLEGLATVWRVLIIVAAVLLSIPSFALAFWIEKDAGFYECGHCHNKYIPTWRSILWSQHIGRTRKMKCPKCGQKSWNKKVISGE